MSQDIYLYDSITKKNADYELWMAFPGPKSFALSSLGFLWVFKEIDEMPDVNAEMVFSDTRKTVALPSEVNLIGFSFSFDMDFLTIFSMLEKYKIPLKAADRSDNLPLVFAGGPVVSANPEPYKDFFDFIIIGDGEDVNLEVVRLCKNNKTLSKKEVLEKLSQIEGVYVPSAAPQRVKKLTKRLTECIYTPILSRDAFFKNTFIVEVSRGCANRCGFCLASYLNLPLRSMPYDELINVIDLGLSKTDKIALLGAQISAHPHFDDICKYIYDKINSGQKIEMSISSLRIDAVKPEIIKTLVAAGQKNTTLAIEAGSERLRKVINKNVAEEQIFNAVKICRENGLKGVKFYGMLGLPTETDEDLAELLRLAEELKKENKGFDISFGFSSFVPKANTPFQWCGREETKSLEDKVNYLKKEFHKLGITAHFSSIKWDYWQAVLSRGDSSLTDFLIAVYENGGKIGAFKSAAKEYIDADYFAINNYSFEKELPWDFIDIKPGKNFLIEENKRLLSLQNVTV